MARGKRTLRGLWSKVPAPALPAYSFCESVTASGRAIWHVRPLTPTGQHFSGGIDTDSLCGAVKHALGGWDIDVPVPLSLVFDQGVCPVCHSAFRELHGEGTQTPKVNWA